MGKSSNLARVVDASGGIGYQAGSGGAVMQATSKGTSVTLNKPSGQITMNNAALAAGCICGWFVHRLHSQHWRCIALRGTDHQLRHR